MFSLSVAAISSWAYVVGSASEVVEPSGSFSVPGTILTIAGVCIAIFFTYRLTLVKTLRDSNKDLRERNDDLEEEHTRSAAELAVLRAQPNLEEHARLLAEVSASQQQIAETMRLILGAVEDHDAMAATRDERIIRALGEVLSDFVRSPQSRTRFGEPFDPRLEPPQA